MLSPSQIEQFRTEGVLVVEDVLDQDTVLQPVRGEYVAILDRLIAQWQASGKLMPLHDGLDFNGKLSAVYRAGLDYFQPMDISLPGDGIEPDTPMHFGPAVFDMMTNPKLLDLVESLLGPEITSNPIQHVRIKPPSSVLSGDETRAHITATDWHQDRGVTHDEADRTDMITVWIAVTDATVENGCLQVIPKEQGQEGSRKLLPHCLKTQVAIPEEFLEYSRARPLPVNSGGVVIFDPLTPHASLVNRTDGFRWSFDIRFNKTGQPTGRAHFPDFVARSHKTPSSVLSDWRTWRALWYDTRAQLSARQHIPIHRWDNSGPYCA